MPMFPLGSVLFPGMPIQLRVFEQRYLIMLDQMLRGGSAEFGVVLIERGQEVGGGEQRFGYGTVAEITSLGAQQGFVGLVATGVRRIRVDAWLPEDPYPRAEVSELAELVWDEARRDDLTGAVQVVRRTLALASEFSELVWPADIELSDDPVTAAWQLAGIAPVGPLDQLSLLRATSVAELLTGVVTACRQVGETYTGERSAEDPGGA